MNVFAAKKKKFEWSFKLNVLIKQKENSFFDVCLIFATTTTGPFKGSVRSQVLKNQIRSILQIES
jgi:hypothetical protein